MAPSSDLLILLLLFVVFSTTLTSSFPYYPPIPSLNPIDSCWRYDPLWSSHRQSLANCPRGFGATAIGGKYGPIYTVTDPSDNPLNPTPGTLRYAAIQNNPLWIIFSRDMSIKLKNELIINSYKTIDGRGVKVDIGNGGPCITIQDVSHVIVHGITIHGCTKGKAGIVRSSPTHAGHRQGSDGDAVTIWSSTDVWIDHCNLSSCFDGLVDVTHGSTRVTISNNLFADHDKVMLFGHVDGFAPDKAMKVTVAFNRFSVDLIQRMPRVRTGYAHVANNRYDGWEMYAIGGSSNPTILSEGNYYVAPNNRDAKEVTKREEGNWKNWKWRSTKDLFLNGAYFVPSGWGSCTPVYSSSQQFYVATGSMVPLLTANAGVLSCSMAKPCV
ncbi:Putative pectate lyase 2 [Dendrobium catenatum]|uniref:Pectate lyase n=2 Tax=Dendrobium catenatum TaxID=906689 RepID=A0A2I0WWW5_9ASPA|nr:Putative pectate lyase 2 [Dendrobium catenatum]